MGVVIKFTEDEMQKVYDAAMQFVKLLEILKDQHNQRDENTVDRNLGDSLSKLSRPRCHVCGRHIDELPVISAPGNIYDGERLVKTYRPDFIADPEAEKAHAEAAKAWNEAGKPWDFQSLYAFNERGIGTLPKEKEELFNYCQKKHDEWFHSWFINRYGAEKGQQFYDYCGPCVGSSWECRDCLILDDDAYFGKLDETWEHLTAERLRRENENVDGSDQHED